MAVITTTRVGGATRAWKQSGGLQVVQAELAVTANGDYSSGITINPLQLGMRKVMAVVLLSVRVTATGVIRGFVGVFDPTTTKLRLYRQNATAVAPLTEAGAAAGEFDPTAAPMTLAVLAFGV